MNSSKNFATLPEVPNMFMAIAQLTVGNVSWLN